MESNLAIKTLVNKLTKLKPRKPSKFIDIHRLPCYYDEYKHISLYAGDWRRIKCDCVYLKTERDFSRLQVLANTKPQTNGYEEDSELKNCKGVIEGAKYVYFGDLDTFTTRALNYNIRSLLIPLELVHTEEHFSKNLVDSLTKMDSMNKIAICAHSNHLWNFYNQLLRHKY